MGASLQQRKSLWQVEIEKHWPIDRITFDPEEHEYVLHLIEDVTPELSHDRLMQIQDRFLEYFEYVITGDMVKDFPDSPFHPFRFQLDCFQTLRGKAVNLIDDTADKLKSMGVNLRVKVLD